LTVTHTFAHNLGAHWVTFSCFGTHELRLDTSARSTSPNQDN